jgi:Homeodomain-like domain
MAEFACGHALRNVGNQFGFIAGGDFSSHRHAHRLAQHVRPAVGGASPLYDPKHYPRYAKFLAERGATQAEIADCFGISTRTLQRWIVQYPELKEAVQAGNEVFNARVERALAERAIGFYADQYTWRATTDQERKQGKPEYVLVPTTRTYYPPDVAAARYWTKNRMRDKWNDVNKVEVATKRRSSEEILEGIHAKLLDLQAKGYLQGLVVPALPPKGDGHG